MRRDDDLLRVRRPEEISRGRDDISRVARLQVGGQSSTRRRRARSDAPTIWVAPPRIFKIGEEWTLKQVRSCNADGYLVRNYDHLKFFANDRRVGDFSLNVANQLSADYFKNKFGLERVTASYDLNFQQLEALLQRRAAGMVRGHDSPAHADVSHGALRVLRVSFERQGLPRLRPPVRQARREAARPRRRGASAQGRRRLPQHRLQRAGANRRGICRNGCWRWACEISAIEFLNETPDAGRADDCQIPPAAARRNFRRATLARIEAVQPARRHARADGQMSGAPVSDPAHS